MRELFGILSILFTLTTGCTHRGDSSYSVQNYNTELVINNIRVALLRVDHSILFSGPVLKNKSTQKTPMISVTYLVEYLGSESIAAMSISNITIKAKNNTNEYQDIDLAPRSQMSFHEYLHFPWDPEFRPNVSDPKRAFVVVEWQQPFSTKNSTFDLLLKAGFTKNSEHFLFTNIPVP